MFDEIIGSKITQIKFRPKVICFYVEGLRNGIYGYNTGNVIGMRNVPNCFNRKIDYALIGINSSLNFYHADKILLIIYFDRKQNIISAMKAKEITQ